MFDTSVVAIFGGGATGNTHGLTMVEQQDYTTNVTTKTGPALPDDELSVMECRASFEEDQAKIEIDLNGESLIRWSGPRTQLAAPAAMTFKGGSQPGLAMGLTEILFHSAEIKMLTGSGKFTHAPAASATANMAVNAKPVDLLKNLKPGRYATAGTWNAGNGQISSTVPVNNQQSSIMLPYSIEGNYELDFKFARTLGRAVVTVYLPVGNGGGVDLVLASSDGKVGSLSAGPRRPGVEAKVETKDGDATIKIELDGKPYLHWSGPASALYARTMPPTHNSRAIGVAVMNPVVRSGATVQDVTVKMTSGRLQPLQ